MPSVCGGSRVARSSRPLAQDKYSEGRMINDEEEGEGECLGSAWRGRPALVQRPDAHSSAVSEFLRSGRHQVSLSAACLSQQRKPGGATNVNPAPLRAQYSLSLSLRRAGEFPGSQTDTDSLPIYISHRSALLTRSDTEEEKGGGGEITHISCRLYRPVWTLLNIHYSPR